MTEPQRSRWRSRPGQVAFSAVLGLVGVLALALGLARANGPGEPPPAGTFALEPAATPPFEAAAEPEDRPSDPAADEPYKTYVYSGATATPTPAIVTRDLTPLVQAMSGPTVPAALKAVDAAVRRGDPAYLAAALQPTITITCIKGVVGRGACPEDVPGADGEIVQLPHIRIDYHGYAPLTHVAKILASTVKGNSGRLVLLSTDEATGLWTAAYALSEARPWLPGSPELFEGLIFIVDPATEHPIVAFGWFGEGGSPLSTYRAIHASERVVAIDEALVDREVREEAEFEQRVKEMVEQEQAEKERSIKAAFGAWKDNPLDADAHIQQIRAEWER